MKDYNKLMDEIERDPDFTITKSGRKATVKVTHTRTGSLYSVHPGDNAIRPLKSWINKTKKQCILSETHTD